MSNEWPILSQPPVVVALFQIKYSTTQFSIQDFLKYENKLKEKFPIKKDNIQVGIDFGTSMIPLGVSRFSATTNATIGAYLFASQDQRKKLEISSDAITFIDENPYKGWDAFKKEVLQVLSIFSSLLQQAEIKRSSIRFVNRLVLPEFNNPADYVNTLITSTKEQQAYPLQQYGFRLMMDIPDSDVYSIVNHNVECLQQQKYLYTLDIDVLCRQCLIFNIDTLSHNMENLRSIKNKIFFDTLTQKTLDLCNL